MRRSIAVLGLVLSVGVGAASMTVLPVATTEAAPGRTFVVPAADGYGIADCVASGSTCGQVVADAWCEAQGFARSASFGPGPAAEGANGAAQPISVTCAE